MQQIERIQHLDNLTVGMGTREMLSENWDAEDFVARLVSGEFNGRISEMIQALSPERLRQAEQILAQRLTNKSTTDVAPTSETQCDIDESGEEDTANVSE